MEPVDTDAIQAEIEQLEHQRSDIDDRVDELTALKDLDRARPEDRPRGTTYG